MSKPIIFVIVVLQICFLTLDGYSAEVTFRDSFDSHSEGATIAGSVSEVGDGWTRLAGNSNLQVVQSATSVSGKAICITRAANGFQGLRGDCDPRTGRLRPHTQTVISADFCRNNDKQAARISLDPLGFPGFKPAVWATAGGNFMIWESHDSSEWQGKWVDTGLPVGSGWQAIEISITWDGEKTNRIRGTYDVYITRYDSHSLGALPRTMIAQDVPTLALPVNTLLCVGLDNYNYKQEDRKSVTYWDNVVVTVEDISEKNQTKHDQDEDDKTIKRSAAPALPNESVGCYISNGDNDILFYSPPIDSRDTIDGLYDMLQKVYGVQRIYWRAAQIEQLLYHSEIRKERFISADLFEWIDYLYENFDLNKYGVEAAHARGMEAWGVAALFDHGGGAVVDSSKGYGPTQVESYIRLREPQWVPVDKYGLRRMSGPICFAYPEARKAMIEMYVKIIMNLNCDGLMFHTYVEEMATRFDDEFGFNEPIVNEFKERYGIDIQSQDFDPNALAALRGEYLTQFFRELKTALKPLNIKVGLFLNPKEPERPQRWLADTSVVCSGRVHVDWPCYIREGIVDELLVYCGGTPYQLVSKILAQVEGSSCKVSILHSPEYPEQHKHLASDGVIRTMVCSYKDIEWGYFDTQPLSALESDDFIARLTVIQQMANGVTEPDVQKIIAATKDENVMVRRRAVAALGELKYSDPNTIVALEKCLNDPENTVRCYAVNTLAKAGNHNSIIKIYDTLDKYHNSMMNVAAKMGLSTLADDRTKDIICGLQHSNPEVRAVVVDAISGTKPRPNILPILLKLGKDSSAKVRWNIAKALGAYRTPESLEALHDFLEDEHPTVRSMAALKLSTLIGANSERYGVFWDKVFVKLRNKFAEYNSTYENNDADWGWRCIGEALERMGPSGIKALNEFLNQDNDKVLADHAWRILYVKQSTLWKFMPITPIEAEQGYRQHPKFSVVK